ncbi:hypothetical protein AOCH_000152 [Aspergillus ochraceoroseus]|uniref:Uncharacterized protein n=1 Tax=Aspergillus ochraceoroseus TaxID=138278 RepID=A0A0F8URU0_9EURO|nr:hypothetical protein AOCH_000152 [Aspergillus ochraceoroseus]
MLLSQNSALRIAGNCFATTFIGFGINALLRPEHALSFFEWQHPTTLAEKQLVDSLMHVYGVRDIFMGLAIYAAAFFGTRQSLGWTLIAASSVAFADGVICWSWGKGEWGHWGYAPIITVVGSALLGLGKGLVTAFLLRPNSIVIAGVRSVATQKATLEELPRADDSQLIVLQLDCTSQSDADEAIATLKQEYGLTYLDVVIANAAIAANYGPASTMPLEHLEAHMKVNAYAVLLLFQATRLLLQEAASYHPPQFILIGAPISTITEMEGCARAPLTNYGLSKLAANYLVRKFHFENKWLLAYIVDPG